MARAMAGRTGINERHAFEFVTASLVLLALALTIESCGRIRRRHLHEWLRQESSRRGIESHAHHSGRLFRTSKSREERTGSGMSLSDKQVKDLGDIIRLDFRACCVIGFDMNGDAGAIVYLTEESQMEEHSLKQLVTDYVNNGGIEASMGSVGAFNQPDEEGDDDDE
jgi:hypothetical protein